MKASDTVMGIKCHCEVYCTTCACWCDYCNRVKIVNKAKVEQAEITWDIAFKAGQQDQAAVDQVVFDKERMEFWRKVAEAKKAGRREVVETYKRENPDLYRKYESWWQSFIKECGIE